MSWQYNKKSAIAKQTYDKYVTQPFKILKF